MQSITLIAVLLGTAALTILARATAAMVARNLFLVGRVPGLTSRPWVVAPFYGLCAAIAFLTQNQTDTKRSSGELLAQCAYLIVGILVFLPVLWLFSRFV